MRTSSSTSVQNPSGKLGVLIVGLNGAVSSTFLAGTLAIRKGVAEPIGSLTQMATIRIGKRTENNFPLIKEFVPLAHLDDLVFGGWDIRNESCYQSAVEAKVLEDRDLARVRGELEQIRPMPGVFEQRFVTRLRGAWVKTAQTKFDLMEMLREDIRTFKAAHGVERLVIIWCGSTEIYLPISEIHRDRSRFERGMQENHPDISPSMLYAYAAIAEGVPFINGAPNLSVDVPVLSELAAENGKIQVAQLVGIVDGIERETGAVDLGDHGVDRLGLGPGRKLLQVVLYLAHCRHAQGTAAHRL